MSFFSNIKQKIRTKRLERAESRAASLEDEARFQHKLESRYKRQAAAQKQIQNTEKLRAKATGAGGGGFLGKAKKVANTMGKVGANFERANADFLGRPPRRKRGKSRDPFDMGF